MRDMEKPSSNELDVPICPHVASQPTEEDLLYIQRKKDAVFEFFTQTLQLYKADQLIFSFNGGKDCTVLLDLLMNFYRNHCIQHFRIPVLYIHSDDAFPEIDEFVDNCSTYFNVELLKYQGSLKEALERVCVDMPHIKGVFMGCRDTDPYCKDLPAMQPTDNGWPQLMRINPILNWSYRDIWNYIRINKVPYCKLYDSGYTSIGYKSNTIPNPHLRYYSATTGTYNYRPAYELQDCALERAGRLAKPKK